MSKSAEFRKIKDCRVDNLRRIALYGIVFNGGQFHVKKALQQLRADGAVVEWPGRIGSFQLTDAGVREVAAAMPDVHNNMIYTAEYLAYREAENRG